MVIDVSGSMFQAGKLECATAAVAAACAHMREGDQSSLTVFGQKAAVVVGMGSAFPAIADLEQLIRKAPVGRSTDLAEGIRTGLGQLAQSAKTEVSDDLLLVTDGVTQNGDQCRLLCKGAGAHHVAISTIGLGVDVNAGLLRDLAEGGRYTFVSSPEELSTIFDQEVRRTQKPVHNARMRLKLMRGVEVRHAYGLTASRRDFGTPEAKGGWLTLPLGDLRQGETVSTLLELEVPAGKSGHSSILQARVEHDGPDPEKSGSPTLKPSIQYANRSSAASRRVLDMVDSCTRFYARR